jgi:hypothetical protein
MHKRQTTQKESKEEFREDDDDGVTCLLVDPQRGSEERKGRTEEQK